MPILHGDFLLCFVVVINLSKKKPLKTSYKYHNNSTMKDSHAEVVLHSLSHNACIRFTEEDLFCRKENKVMGFPFAGLELDEKEVFQ